MQQQGMMGQPMMGQPGMIGRRGVMGQQGMMQQPGMMGRPGMMQQPGMMGQPMMGQPMMGGGMMGQPVDRNRDGIPDQLQMGPQPGAGRNLYRNAMMGGQQPMMGQPMMGQPMMGGGMMGQPMMGQPMMGQPMMGGMQQPVAAWSGGAVIPAWAPRSPGQSKRVCWHYQFKGHCGSCKPDGKHCVNLKFGWRVVCHHNDYYDIGGDACNCNAVDGSHVKIKRDFNTAAQWGNLAAGVRRF